MYCCNFESNGPSNDEPAYTSVTFMLNGTMSFLYSLFTSFVTKSCNSATNSQDVGPSPTTTNDNKRLLSFLEVPGIEAFSKESIMLFLIFLVWYRCFKHILYRPLLVI